MNDMTVLSIANLEYNLQIGHHFNCWCGRYLTERREVLLPEMIKICIEKGHEDPDDFVAQFVGKLHREKCPTMPQPRPYIDQLVDALRDTIGEDPGPRESPDDTSLELRKPHYGLPRQYLD